MGELYCSRIDYAVPYAIAVNCRIPEFEHDVSDRVPGDPGSYISSMSTYRSVLCTAASGGFWVLLVALMILPAFFVTRLFAGSTVASQGVILAWNKSPESAVTGYRIHSGSFTGRYDEVFDVKNVLQLAVFGMGAGDTNFFVAQSYAGSMAVSPYSAELRTVATRLLAVDTTPVGSTPAPGVTSVSQAYSTGLMLDVDWPTNRGSAFVNYRLFYGLSTNAMNEVVVTGGKPRVTLVGMKPATTYYFSARALVGTMGEVTLPSIGVFRTQSALNYRVERLSMTGSWPILTSGLTQLAAAGVSVTNSIPSDSATGASSSGSSSNNISLPSPWSSKDIGTVGGSSQASAGRFTITGEGTDIGGSEDQFQYVYQQASGDCTLVARLISLDNTNPLAKAGLMVRETLTPNSKHASILLSPMGGATFQWRSSSGGASSTVSSSSSQSPYWLKLVRAGDQFTGYTSLNGTAWVSMGSATVAMASSVSIGMAVTSHNDGILCTAVLDYLTPTP